MKLLGSTMTTGNHPYETQFLRLGGKNRQGEDIEVLTERAESRQAAYATLKGMTGQDFGYDAQKWRAWMEENPDWNQDRIKMYVENYKGKS